MQRAKQTFFAPGRRVAKGELFDDGDPFLKGREVLFEHIDVPEPQPKAEEPKAEEPKAEEPKPAPRKTAAKKPAG
ncbi:hypothetical protein [Streptomyces sp. NPDC057381]|uniref:hypothetical protein n=1 Tax=Streptomyces sp. NPDC057381 TaxID=3346111 RepID=UPI003637A286